MAVPFRRLSELGRRNASGAAAVQNGDNADGPRGTHTPSRARPDAVPIATTSEHATARHNQPERAAVDTNAANVPFRPLATFGKRNAPSAAAVQNGGNADGSRGTHTPSRARPDAAPIATTSEHATARHNQPERAAVDTIAANAPFRPLSNLGRRNLPSNDEGSLLPRELGLTAEVYEDLPECFMDLLSRRNTEHPAIHNDPLEKAFAAYKALRTQHEDLHVNHENLLTGHRHLRVDNNKLRTELEHLRAENLRLHTEFEHLRSIQRRGGERRPAAIPGALSELSLHLTACGECSIGFNLMFRGITEDPAIPYLAVRCRRCDAEAARWDV